MSKFITKQSFSINYETYGPSTAAVSIIFAHGNGNCVEDWYKLGYVDKLTASLPEVRLVFMDALGYGQSDKPTAPEDYTPERRAEDVICLLDHLKLDKTVFFGASIGGSLGFVLADLYPERFSAFIIGSAHPYGLSQPIGCNIFDATFRETIKTSGMLAFVTELETRFLKKPFDPAVRPQYIKNDADAIVAANTPDWPDRSAILSTIQVPTLLFAGADDPVSEFQATIASKISNAEVTILPQTDHCDAYWDSKKVVSVIAEFIRKNYTQLASQ
jgi:pimeloyl-ACP methyl ester carboxylesterase